jgi:4'-phosphopantetheinyl transferase
VRRVDGVDLWCVNPERITDPGLLQRYRQLLSSTEMERLQRIRRAGSAHRFLVSHALVRSVLSRYAEIAPETWRFETGSSGKPEIASAGAPPMRFNLSHTSGMSVCAVTAVDDVGVDVERTDRQADLEGVARRAFSRHELESLDRIAPSELRRAFFQRWTLREAYVKARGQALLQVPRDSVSFTVGEDGKPEVSFGRQGPDRAGNWYFFLRTLGDAHLCAVAVCRGETGAPSLTVRETVPLQASSSSFPPS